MGEITVTPPQSLKWCEVGKVATFDITPAPPPHLVRGVGCGEGHGTSTGMTPPKWGGRPGRKLDARSYQSPTCSQCLPEPFQPNTPTRGNMSFKKYVQSRRAGESPSGDVTRELRRDRSLPSIKSWDQLRGYLHTRFAASETIDAARTVWRGYLSERKRKFSAEPGAAARRPNH